MPPHTSKRTYTPKPVSATQPKPTPSAQPKPARHKRILVSPDAPNPAADDIPLSRLINFGPVTIQEFEAMRIRTLSELREMGWEAACRRWVESFPERLNANAFIGVIATLEGIPWTQATRSQRAQARALVHELRREFGVA